MHRGVGSGFHQLFADSQSSGGGGVLDRQAEGGHRAGDRACCPDLRIEASGEQSGASGGEQPVSLAQRGAPKAIMELDGLRHRQKAARIGGTGPVELRQEALVIAMGDRAGVQTTLGGRLGVQKGTTFRGAQPFMAISDVPVGTNRGQVEIDLAGCMGAIDQDANAGGVARCNDLLGWQDDRTGRCDVVDNREPGAGTIAAAMAAVSDPSVGSGKGIEASAMWAPARLVTKRTVFRTAP
jgi:hypothetical protein